MQGKLVRTRNKENSCPAQRYIRKRFLYKTIAWVKFGCKKNSSTKIWLFLLYSSLFYRLRQDRGLNALPADRRGRGCHDEAPPGGRVIEILPDVMISEFQ